jgi:hypothetical protein
VDPGELYSAKKYDKQIPLWKGVELNLSCLLPVMQSQDIILSEEILHRAILSRGRGGATTTYVSISKPPTVLFCKCGT